MNVTKDIERNEKNQENKKLISNYLQERTIWNPPSVSRSLIFVKLIIP